MKLVERYIFYRALKISGAALLVALAMAWTTQILARVNIVTDSGQTAGTFLELATLLLPTVIPVVMPFAIIIGISQTLSAMNQDSELAVIAAAGSSRGTILKPMLVLAALASALSFAVDNWVEPTARQRTRTLVASAHADLLSSVIQEGNFRKVQEGLFVQVAERLPNGRMGGIFVADSRKKDLDLYYYAKQGEVQQRGDQQFLFMIDGEVHRKTPGGDVSVVRFASYAFDLSEFAPTGKTVQIWPKDRTLGYLFNPDPNDAYLQWSPPFFYAELHRRLSEWSYSLVFALLALAAAGDARSHRQARIHPMVTAISIALLVRWEGYFVANKAETVTAFVPLIYAVPILNAAFACYLIAASKTLELPASWSDQLAHFFAALRMRARALRWPGTRHSLERGSG
ncbi:LPS export ABC transporter permease LptF [Nitratireductor alexandrii]|uniref:LPS export ABC transporter permease LptF n=1 Tax=Nitratireductor alexandrii TaxID=2448161 RepID=UPI000FD7B817|nr:LPS export ABC transporter permease LptF [Nitratireductor alexandrii]